MPSRVPRLVAAALITAAAAGLLPGPATAAPAPPATQKATFGLQPATKGKPDARPYLSYQTSAGGTFTDQVALLNYSAFPLDLQLYVGSLSNAANGSLSVSASDAPLADAAAWTHLDGGPRTVHIAAGTPAGPAEALLPVGLAVPLNATPGDHVAAVVASLQTLGKNPKGENVRLLQRVALRIFVRVNGTIRSHYTIERVKVGYGGTLNPFGAGHADVTYSIRNDGNVSIGVSQRLKVSGWFGDTGTAPKIDDIPVLLPGNTVQVHVRVKNVWPEVRLSAKVTGTSLRTGASIDTLLPAVSASASTWAIPWPLLVLLVLLVGASFGARKWWTRGRRAYAGRRRSR
jgi:hypothetical protein